MNDLDHADNVPVELAQFFRRHPELERFEATDLLYKISLQKFVSDLESRHVADVPGRGVFGVPIPRDLNRVPLGQDRIEDWLVLKTWWKRTEAAVPN